MVLPTIHAGIVSVKANATMRKLSRNPAHTLAHRPPAPGNAALPTTANPGTVLRRIPIRSGSAVDRPEITSCGIMNPYLISPGSGFASSKTPAGGCRSFPDARSQSRSRIHSCAASWHFLEGGVRFRRVGAATGRKRHTPPSTPAGSRPVEAGLPVAVGFFLCPPSLHVRAQVSTTHERRRTSLFS